MVPLETLHMLPKPGDIVLFPGHPVGDGVEFLPGAYLVGTVENFFSRVDHMDRRPQEVRLTKAAAPVTSLNPTMTG